MSEYTIKLAGALPKGDGNGFSFTDAAGLAEEALSGGETPPRVALVVYGVKKAEVDKDGVKTTTLEVLRVEPVNTLDGRRQVEALLAAEYAARTGNDTLPFELVRLNKAAFADLPRTTAEVDAEQERERDMMSPADELRRHMVVVHGRPEAEGWTDAEAQQHHDAEHEADGMPEALKHDRGWHGWTRADLELAEVETDGQDTSVEDARAEVAVGGTLFSGDPEAEDVASGNE